MPTSDPGGREALLLGGTALLGAEVGGVGLPEGGEVLRSDRRIFRAFLDNKLAIAGLGLLLLITLFCVLGPVFYPTNQITVQLGRANLPPSGQFPLGTDASGYNILGRLMEGGRSSLLLGTIVAITSTFLGTIYGAIAGYVGGIVDSILMRLVDTFLAIPGLVLLLILVSMFTPNLTLIIILLSLLSWLTVSRLVRAEVLTLKTRDYVHAARVMGSGSGRIIARHLIPNAMGVMIVNATFTVADAILSLSALSFLGLGIPPPYADWGTMLSNGLDYLFDGYWWEVYPAAIILVLTVVAFNLIGDAIRDSLDVRLRRR